MQYVHGNFYYDSSSTPPEIKRVKNSSGIIDAVELLLTHDLIRFDGGLKRVDLRIFSGNMLNAPLKPYLKDYNDQELSDLVLRDDGRLPLDELKEARTLLRQLELDSEFKRHSYLCQVCNDY